MLIKHIEKVYFNTEKLFSLLSLSLTLVSLIMHSTASWRREAMRADAKVSHSLSLFFLLLLCSCLHFSLLSFSLNKIFFFYLKNAFDFKDYSSFCLLMKMWKRFIPWNCRFLDATEKGNLNVMNVITKCTFINIFFSLTLFFLCI